MKDENKEKINPKKVSVSKSSIELVKDFRRNKKPE